MKGPGLQTSPLGLHWTTLDPFLFCAHHRDSYPKGNERLGPAASLDGRALGHDFQGRDGWNMYHGTVVPGFPQHPHRGFETVSIARSGFIDHSDSLGARARFGRGDVQWMTAGAGVVHAEMFPLLDSAAPNPVELFQIWLNLPAKKKLVPPRFSIFWANLIPRKSFTDPHGRATRITVVAGQLDGLVGCAPPPDSWAADPRNEVNIWNLELDAGARFTLPAARDPRTLRSLYFFSGEALRMGGVGLVEKSGYHLSTPEPIEIEAVGGAAEILVLSGRPIDEPVFQYGPFVMSSAEEIQEALEDYGRTEFGGWPWPSDDPVFDRSEGRIARHADGRVESPDE